MLAMIVVGIHGAQPRSASWVAGAVSIGRADAAMVRVAIDITNSATRVSLIILRRPLGV